MTIGSQTGARTARGNALFLILIAVALFAALSYAVTQSGRGSGSAARETAQLEAASILNYAALMQTAITRIRTIGGCADTEVNFDTPALIGYDNTGAPADGRCDVFATAGGGVTYVEPKASILDSTYSASAVYGDWVFSGKNLVDGQGCDISANVACRDLIMTLLYLNKEVCLALNKTLGIANPAGEAPTETSGTPYAVKFDGDYATGTSNSTANNDAALADQPAGCFKEASATAVDPAQNAYVFYNTLIAK